MSTDDALFLCLDCGGTKTGAVVCDVDGHILGRGFGGPSNFKDVDFTSFLAAVRTASERALSAVDRLTVVQSDPVTPTSPSPSSPLASWFGFGSSSLSSNGTRRRSKSTSTKRKGSIPSPAANPNGISLPYSRPLLKAVWVGCSGIDREQDITDLTPVFANLFSIPPGPNLIIANDTTLLASPLQHHSDVSKAVVAIAGTGCIAVSFEEDKAGNLQTLGRTGGWGWILGDEGSGYFIGRETIRRLLAQADAESIISSSVTSTPSGTPGTGPSLQSRVFAHYGITSATDLFTVVYAPEPGRTMMLPSSQPQLASPASAAASRSKTHIPKLSATFTPTPKSPIYTTQERKVRITSLTPLVFQSAFTDSDPLALSILRASAQHLALYISQLVALPESPDSSSNTGLSASPSPSLSTTGTESSSSSLPIASESVLCFGGSLVGVPEYRALVLDELKSMGHVFPYVEHVTDAAESGALRLAAIYRGRNSSARSR